MSRRSRSAPRHPRCQTTKEPAQGAVRRSPRTPRGLARDPPARPIHPSGRAALLFVPLAVFGLLGPNFSAVYDWRYVVPMFGFAAAAAGIGGWAVIVVARGRLAARRRT